MTKVRRAIIRETRATVREQGAERRVVVTLYPGGTIGLRAKGCRHEYQLPVGAVYMQAVRAHVEAGRRPRKTVQRGLRA